MTSSHDQHHTAPPGFSSSGISAVFFLGQKPLLGWLYGFPASLSAQVGPQSNHLHAHAYCPLAELRVQAVRKARSAADVSCRTGSVLTVLDGVKGPFSHCGCGCQRPHGLLSHEP